LPFGLQLADYVIIVPFALLHRRAETAGSAKAWYQLPTSSPFTAESVQLANYPFMLLPANGLAGLYAGERL